MKFHARKLYGYLMNLHLKFVLKKLSLKPDIVWDFNSSFEYGDLSAFFPAFRIFQPVDQIRKELIDKDADVMVTISEKIADQYKKEGIPKLVVSHGVADLFIQLAQKAPRLDINQPIRAGYIGNLCIESMHKQLLQQLVAHFPDVEFHLVGPYDKGDNNLVAGLDDEHHRFVTYLRNAENVVLYGPRSQKDVADMLDTFDINLLCYRKTASYQNDNSHKVLEYMAAGKVVVSTALSFYNGNQLLQMAEGIDNYLDLFGRVKEKISSYNSADLQQQRKQLALNNSYEKQITRIENFLEKTLEGGTIKSPKELQSYP
jgi:glycosyltransferase involved in cell wall biosynthesis